MLSCLRCLVSSVRPRAKQPVSASTAQRVKWARGACSYSGVTRDNKHAPCLQGGVQQGGEGGQEGEARALPRLQPRPGPGEPLGSHLLVQEQLQGVLVATERKAVTTGQSQACLGARHVGPAQ